MLLAALNTLSVLKLMSVLFYCVYLWQYMDVCVCGACVGAVLSCVIFQFGIWSGVPEYIFASLLERFE